MFGDPWADAVLEKLECELLGRRAIGGGPYFSVRESECTVLRRYIGECEAELRGKVFNDLFFV
jgi:hypothetical protein